MVFDPDIHHRRSIRLRTHDYAAGGIYYITICAEERRRLFGVVVNGHMALNEAGRMVRDVWNEIPAHCPEYRIDEFVVMPNHFHGVVAVVVPPGMNVCPSGASDVGAALRGRPHGPIDVGQSGASDTGEGQARRPAPDEGQARRPAPDEGQARRPAPTVTGTPSLPDFVYRLKSLTTKRYIDGVKHHGWPPFPGKLWQRNYYEHIVRNDADLARIRAYICDNPANWDVLRYGEPRFMIGNRALLDLPKTAYLASRGAATESRPYIAFPARPACVISGFLSPMERLVFDACLADGTPMIQVLARGLPKAFPPRVQRAIDAGRLLVMTPFAEDINRVNAVRAAWCNQYLLHAADSVVIGYLNPDGMLACLLADMPDNKPVEVLAVAARPFVV